MATEGYASGVRSAERSAGSLSKISRQAPEDETAEVEPQPAGVWGRHAKFSKRASTTRTPGVQVFRPETLDCEQAAEKDLPIASIRPAEA